MPRKQWGSRLSLPQTSFQLFSLPTKYCWSIFVRFGGTCWEESAVERRAGVSGAPFPVEDGRLSELAASVYKETVKNGERQKKRRISCGVFERRGEVVWGSQLSGGVGAYQRAGLSRWGLWAPSYHTRQPPSHQTNKHTRKQRNTKWKEKKQLNKQTSKQAKTSYHRAGLSQCGRLPIAPGSLPTLKASLHLDHQIAHRHTQRPPSTLLYLSFTSNREKIPEHNAYGPFSPTTNKIWSIKVVSDSRFRHWKCPYWEGRKGHFHFLR